MGAQIHLEKVNPVLARDLPAIGFLRKLAQSVLELGEIAQIEIEIKRSYPFAAPQPRCPLWHHAGGTPHESLATKPHEREAKMRTALSRTNPAQNHEHRSLFVIFDRIDPRSL